MVIDADDKCVFLRDGGHYDPRQRMACWLRLCASIALMLGGCVGGSAGPATGLPPGSAASTAQAQNVQAVTTVAAAVTAGLVAAPANPSTQFAIIDTPAHGSVTQSGATFTYTPANGYSGADAFHYVAVSGSTTSPPATVSVEVLSAAVAPPSLATACTDLGPAFTPVCTAIAGVTTPLVQACSSVAPSDFCSIYGGNQYGLVSFCFDAITGYPAVLCKAISDELQAVGSQCRVLNGPIDFCAIYTGSAIGDRAVQSYLAGPVHQALKQQYQLGLTLPLRNALVPATHNSYNFTNANIPPTISGLDPDQLYSMVNQLDLDMRGLELDVHWFPHLGAPGGYAPILCHGFTNHLGCTFERTFAAGLTNIRGWLDAHPEAVIILDVEEHLDESVDDVTKSFPAAAAAIESTLGRNSARDILFRPGQLQPGATCVTQDIPLDVTLEQIQAAGKQVLMYSAGCGHDPTGWDSIIFDESDRLQDEANAFDGSQYPNCHFTRAQYENSWTRFYDSSTLIDALAGAGSAQPVSPAEIHEMVRCGVNMPSINFLDPHAGQPEAFVWSWAYGQPLSTPAQQCAVHNGDGRFQAEACGQFLPYVCGGGNSWHITTTPGLFDGGGSACAAEFPGSGFAVPLNGFQNELLKTAKAQAGVARVWLDYTDRGNGSDWVAGPSSAPQPAPAPGITPPQLPLPGIPPLPLPVPAMPAAPPGTVPAPLLPWAPSPFAVADAANAGQANGTVMSIVGHDSYQRY